MTLSGTEAFTGQPTAVAVQNFSHISVGVSDIDTSYTDVLGMDVVFDVELQAVGPIEIIELRGGASSTVQLWRPGQTGVAEQR